MNEAAGDTARYWILVRVDSATLADFDGVAEVAVHRASNHWRNGTAVRAGGATLLPVGGRV